MTILIGTESGVFRVEELPFDQGDEEYVLESGHVTGVRAFDCTDGVFATSASGLFRSFDSGETWEELDIPVADSEVWSVLATPDGQLYVGTNDPYLFRSRDDGETWTELRGFRELPSRGVWESPLDPHRSRLRTLDAHPERPDRLVVGMESGGVHVSDDGGQTWTDRRENGPDDIHNLRLLSPDVYIAATGHLDLDLEHLGQGHAVGAGGVYRTTDGGKSWERLDVGNEYSYVHDVFVADGSLYFCGATASPPDWRATHIDAALFESDNLGRSFEPASYPGEPREIIENWARLDDRIICGTALFGDVDASEYIRGRILGRTDEGEYETLGSVPSNVTRLETL